MTITPLVPKAATSAVTINVAPAPSPDPQFRQVFPIAAHRPSNAREVSLPFDNEATIIPLRQKPPAPLIDEVILSDAELDEAEFSRRPTASAALPPAQFWVEKFAQGAFEVMAGRRSIAQFARWTNRSVYFHLQHRSGLLDLAPRIHHVHICEPADGITEASVTVQLGGRLRAAALRFEGLDGRWICTSLVLC